MKTAAALLSLVAMLGGLSCTEPQKRSRAENEQRVLALAPATGTDALAVEIRGKETAQAKHETPGGWIALGRAWVRLARHTSDPGFYLSADACASLALAREPSSIPARNLRALVLLNAHRFAEARDLAHQILVEAPDDLDALATESDARLELGDLAGAGAAVDRMREIRPGLPAFSRASWLCWLRGDREGALRFAALAVDAGDARDPEPTAWVLVQAAQIYWNTGDVEGADAGYDAALARVPDFSPALLGKGRIAMARGRHAAAIELFERAFRANPLAETAWLLGDAQDAAGDHAAAARTWQQLDTGDLSRDRRTVSAFLSAKGRDPERALALIEEESKTRGGPFTDDALAWALFRNGRLDDALAASDRARSPGLREPALLFHAGAIRIALGRQQEGLQFLKRAVAANPAFERDGAEEARTLLTRR